MAKSGIRRIGVLTGGGDAPGLNAVIRAAALAATGIAAHVAGRTVVKLVYRPGEIVNLVVG